MKKYILFFLIFTLLIQINNLAFAAEKESSSSWGENTSVFNSGFSGQKPVTDNKLNKTIKMLKERYKRKFKGKLNHYLLIMIWII